MRPVGLESVAFAALLALAAAAPAPADWLVTADGAEIETRGPWRVESRLVLFTSADGALQSLRLADADLEASARVTEFRARPRPAPARPARPAARRPVLVLTDADVERQGPAEPVAAANDPEPESEPDPQPEPGAAAPPEVVVESWQVFDEREGLGLSGWVANHGSAVAIGVQVEVTFNDEDGDPVASRKASLSTSTLKRGQRAEFRVEPFGLFTYGSVEIDVSNLGLLTGRGAEDPAAADPG